jgi:hypothetical protein
MPVRQGSEQTARGEDRPTQADGGSEGEPQREPGGAAERGQEAAAADAGAPTQPHQLRRVGGAERVVSEAVERVGVAGQAIDAPGEPQGEARARRLRCFWDREHGRLTTDRNS